LLAGLTEYWRAYRQYAGVLHFVYLTSSDPAGYTADHFRDVTKLELHPEFQDYMSNAFAPVGVYLSFWQASVVSASTVSLPVMLVNDEDRPVEGTVTLALQNGKGDRISAQTLKFKIAALGQETIYNDFRFPQATGDFLLRAIVEYRSNDVSVSAQSRRYVKIVEPERKQK
jgi:beta-galactosidase